MKNFTEYNGENFSLTCWGNGLAYELRQKKLNQYVYLQGDDAAQFEKEYEEIEDKFPLWKGDRICAWLWSECGYELAAKDIQLTAEEKEKINKIINTLESEENILESDIEKLEKELENKRNKLELIQTNIFKNQELS